MTKEFRLALRVKNNRLIKAREELDLTLRQAAESAGVPYSQLCGFESMRIHPLGKRGWRRGAVRISSFYGSPPDHFWPEAVLAVQKTTMEVEASAPELMRLAGPKTLDRLPAPEDGSPEEQFVAEEAKLAVWQLVQKLPKREQEVLYRTVAGDETLKDVGESLGVGRGRARQIQARGLRRLREFSAKAADAADAARSLAKLVKVRPGMCARECSRELAWGLVCSLCEVDAITREGMDRHLLHRSYVIFYDMVPVEAVVAPVMDLEGWK